MVVNQYLLNAAERVANSIQSLSHELKLPFVRKKKKKKIIGIFPLQRHSHTAEKMFHVATVNHTDTCTGAGIQKESLSCIIVFISSKQKILVFGGSSEVENGK